MSAVVVAGNTSGSVSLTAPDVAGTTVITLPTTSGTMALSGGAGSFTTVVASSTIKGATTIAVGNATPSASGAGITFPATQSASTDANTLDDYEEGTWTPSQGTGLTVVGAFSSSGTYTKIGRVVTVVFNLNGATSITCATSGLLCGGLPFTAATSYFGVITNASNNETNIFSYSGNANLYLTAKTVVATTAFYSSITYCV